MNDIRATIDILNRLHVLKENKGHLDHPEDLVFIDGMAGARSAIAAIEQTISNPDSITLKFDGYPALIFGRGSDGKFTIMDKHMFNKKDGSGRQIYSPKQFQEYDAARGVNRNELYSIINTIWKGLEQEDRASTGYYWGDLLFRSPLEEDNGLFKFKANPNGITYTVDTDSSLGKLLAGKVAGIAVHQFIPAEGISLDQATSLNGSIGKLTNNSNVAIVPSKMPITPNLQMPTKLLDVVNREIEAYGQSIDQLFDDAPQARSSFGSLFTVYVNKKIVSGNLSNLIRDFMVFIENRKMSDGMRLKITQHINANKQGLLGAFKVWIALYNLKMSVVAQLNKAAESSPVKGYLQDGTQTHEGFVANNVKLIDRMGFSRQNLSGK